MIKNILFDFGGVLFNIDYNKTITEFKNLGFTQFEEMFTQFKADAFFQNFETGKISTEDFYKSLIQAAPQPVTAAQIKNAWNAMLLDFRKESLAFLEHLKDKYRLFLLSNTNQVHYDAFVQMLREQTSYENMESFFTKAYYSHIIHLRKPDVEAFTFVLNDAGIIAEETLFVDDTAPNLTNAQILGMHTHLLLPDEKIELLDYNNL